MRHRAVIYVSVLKRAIDLKIFGYPRKNISLHQQKYYMQTSNLGEPLLLGDLGLGDDPDVLPLHEDQSEAGTVVT